MVEQKLQLESLFSYASRFVIIRKTLFRCFTLNCEGMFTLKLFKPYWAEGGKILENVWIKLVLLSIFDPDSNRTIFFRALLDVGRSLHLERI